MIVSPLGTEIRDDSARPFSPSYIVVRKSGIIPHEIAIASDKVDCLQIASTVCFGLHFAPNVLGKTLMLEAARYERKPRVLVADDQAVVAAGVRTLIEPACEVVGVVRDGRDLLIEAEKLQPDIIVMEVLLPLLNGLDAARHLAKLVPESKIVFLTIQASATLVVEAFRAGASAYVLKRSPSSELGQAIHEVMSGQRYITPLITTAMLPQPANGATSEVGRPTVSSLTPRQREVLQLIAEGRGTKEVAALLNIAVKTVEFHKFRIMDQLGLHSTVALTKHAIIEGLISL